MTKNKIKALIIHLLLIALFVYVYYEDGNKILPPLLVAINLIVCLGIMYYIKTPDIPVNGWPYWMTTRQIFYGWLCILGVTVPICMAPRLLYTDYRYLVFILVPLSIASAFAYRYFFFRNAPKDGNRTYPQLLAEHRQAETYVPVADFNDVESARIVRDMLISKGIDAITYNEVIPDFISREIKPIQVCVSKKDKEIAVKLIND